MDKEKQDKFSCKHLECDMDGAYCTAGHGHGYGWCVLPFKQNECKYFEKKPKSKMVKITKNEVVISKEEYEELINLQQTHAKDLTNAIQSYEEKKADLKLEYNNHIKNLEKIIDRQSKDLNSQADRLIDLKEQLKEMEEQRDKQAYITEDLIQEKHLWSEQARKETAEKIFDVLYQWLRLEEIEKYGFVTIQKFDFLRKFREIYKQLGVDLGDEK